MTLYVYKPDEINIYLGIPPSELLEEAIPGLPLISTEITDWVQMTTQKSNQSFNYERGIFGEPFLDMNNDTSRIYSLTILQTSNNIEALTNILLAQRVGIIGYPFSMIDNGKDSNSNSSHQKGFAAVSWIIDEPDEIWTKDGAAWVYKIQVVALLKTFF